MLQNRAFALTFPLHVALASAMALSGCTHGASNGASDAATDAKATGDGGALAARPPLRPFRHGGMAGLAFNAAHDAQLTDDQAKSIEELQAKLSVSDPAQRTAFTDYQAHVNAGTKSGKFDEAQLKADYAAIDAVRRADEDREVEALNGLHALLTPEQRTIVVNNVRAKQAQIDMQKAPPMPDGGVDDRVKATLTRMTTDLTLDASQQKRVSDLLVKDERLAASSFPARKEEQKKHADDFIASFEQADYDAKAQMDGPDGGTSPHEQMEKEVRFLGQLLAILKPDQREKLAAERSPAAPGQHHMIPGMGGPGGPGGPPGMPGMPGMRPGPGGPGMPMGAPPPAPPPPAHS
jgi:Spy/CpxP family protein refolding chaperone